MANGRAKLSFGIIGIQLASRQMLSRIAREAADRNHSVISHLSARPPNEFFLQERFDALLMSISAAGKDRTHEIGIIKEHTESPLVMVYDTINAINRVPRELRTKIALNLVPHPDEVEVALREGFSNVTFAGLPPHWAHYLRTRLDRTTARALLRKSCDLIEFFPIDEAEVVFIVGGVRDCYTNNRMFRAVVTAGNEQYGDRFVLIARPHPNETFPEDPEERRRVLDERRRILEGVWQVDTSGFDTMDPFLMAADFFVASGGVTAILYLAAERLPIIYFDERENQERLQEMIDQDTWLPIRRGVAERAFGYAELIEKIHLLGTGEGRWALIKRQKAFLPSELVAASRTETERAYVDVLEQRFLPDPITERVPH